MENRAEQAFEAELPIKSVAEERRIVRRRAAGRLFGALGVFFVALLLGLFIAFLSERVQLDGRVARGVEVDGLSLQGVSRNDLPRALAPLRAKIEERTIILSHDENTLEKQSLALGFRLEQQILLEQALAQGRQGSFFSQFLFFSRSLLARTKLSPGVSVNEEELSDTLDAWTIRFLKPPVEPSLSYDKQLRIRYPEPGETVNVPELRAALLKKLLNSNEPIALELPTAHSAPLIEKETVDARAAQARLLLSAPIVIVDEEKALETRLTARQLGAALSSEVKHEPPEFLIRLDAEKLRASLKSFLAEVEKTVQEASFEVDSRGKIAVIPSAPGVKVEEAVLAERLLALGKQKPRRVFVPTVSLLPQLSTAQAEKLGIVGLVSSFTTHHACCQPRVDNIHAVAKKIDGVVVPPGATFSLNAFLGPRIGNADYKNAPTIVHGEMQETTGGGISQFATTFFNALLDGGYAIVQRQPHSFYFPRYPEGHEATISFPEPDLTFKNDTEAGVLIKTQYSGTFIKVSLYGDNGGRKSFRHKSSRYNFVKPPIEYEADPEMDPEKQKRLRAGQTGWSLVVSRTIVFPDKTEKKEQREVVYKPRPELIRTHPCNIPEGEKGHTGEECPEPEREEREEELSDEDYYDTVPEPGASNEGASEQEEGD